MTDGGYRVVHNAHDIVGPDVPISVHGSGSYSDAKLVIVRPGQKEHRQVPINLGGGLNEEDRAKRVTDGWAKIKRATKVTAWQYVPALDVYVPASANLSNLRTHRGLGPNPRLVKINGKPIEHRPCGVGMAQDMGRWTSFSTCWRPSETADGRCSMHRKAIERAAVKDAERQERWAESDRQYERARENRRRAAEALAVLRSAVEPLGIRPATITAPDQTVELPPEVAETLAQFLGEYDELRNL